MDHDHITPLDVYKALSAALICLGRRMPPDLAQHLASDLRQMGQGMADNGEPIPGTLTTDLAKAVLASHSMKTRN